MWDETTRKRSDIEVASPDSPKVVSSSLSPCTLCQKFSKSPLLSIFERDVSVSLFVVSIIGFKFLKRNKFNWKKRYCVWKLFITFHSYSDPGADAGVDPDPDSEIGNFVILQIQILPSVQATANIFVNLSRESYRCKSWTIIADPSKEDEDDDKSDDGNGGSYPALTLIIVGLNFSVPDPSQSDITSIKPKVDPTIKKLPDKMLNEFVGPDN